MDTKNAIKKRYYFVTIILFLLGLILLFLPHRKNMNDLSPESLLLAISTQDQFYSPDEVARLIISEDPSVLLIDVRNNSEYNEFSLPGAINIPLSSILDKDEKGEFAWEDYIDNEALTTIFYSNGTVYANQAWMLTKRLNFKNNYVMDGGLNRFFKEIILAKKPLNSAPEEEHHTYQFRKAAAMYFGGGNVNISIEASNNKPANIIPPKKKKEKMEDGGGC